MSLRESGINHETLRAIEEADWAAENPDKVVRCPVHPSVLMVESYNKPGTYRCRECPPEKRYARTD